MLVDYSDLRVSKKNGDTVFVNREYLYDNQPKVCGNMKNSQINSDSNFNLSQELNNYSSMHKEKRIQHSAEVDDLIKALGGLSLDKDFWVHTASMVKSNSRLHQFEGTKQFRMMLSVSGDIPIQDVIDTGVVPCLVNFITNDMDSSLQFEAAWALTNIASGTSCQTEVVVKAGAIPNLLSLIESEREDIREQGMWGLGNIAGDRAEFRDYILMHYDNCLYRYINACKKSKKISTIRTGIWSLSNLCRGKPRPDFHYVASAIPYLASILSFSTDNDTLIDACWALDGLSEHSSAISDIISQNIVALLVRMLYNKDVAIQRPALRVIGQVAAGDVLQTQEIINHGALSPLKSLLTSSRKGIRKDSCWTLSNVAAGTPAQLQELLNQGIITDLFHIFYSDSEQEVRREAAWAICNACTTNVDEQLQYLVSNNCLKSLCDMLLLEDSKIIEVALDAIEHVLHFGERFKSNTSFVNVCVDIIRNSDGIPNIYHLYKNSHEFANFKICEKSSTIIHKWFNQCII